MEISNKDMHEATKLYLDLKKQYYTMDNSNENMSALYGAGGVLTLLGINTEGLGKHHHCPICGRYYGKSFTEDGTDPECPNCGWEGKY